MEEFLVYRMVQGKHKKFEKCQNVSVFENFQNEFLQKVHLLKCLSFFGSSANRSAKRIKYLKDGLFEKIHIENFQKNLRFFNFILSFDHLID